MVVYLLKYFLISKVNKEEKKREEIGEQRRIGVIKVENVGKQRERERWIK